MSENTQNLIKLNKAVAAYSSAGRAFKGCSTGLNDTFSAKASVSVRNEYTKTNYSAARPSERVPTDFLEVLSFCNESYYNVDIVRNVIDLMADFCVKGIDWAHSNKGVQAFYREWFNTVHGKDVSERFCNYLFRLGNLAVMPERSKISEEIADSWKKTKGQEFKSIKTKNLEIPSGYTFLDVTALQEDITPANISSGERLFRVGAAGGLISTFTNYNLTFRSQNGSSFSGRLYQSLPNKLKSRVAESNGNLILKDGEDIFLYHYRKDDWDTWSRPIILCIAEPLIMLKKMHLADMSALDGVISNVRLWKLGYIDTTNIVNSIIPTPEMLEYFSNMLLNNISGGVLDVVWGPALELIESASTAHHFLFSEKYTQVMNEIYDGLGINPSMAGGSGAGNSGMTNNAISMKVLVERLAYVRNKLIDFWTRESRIIQKAMGFSTPAKIQFDDAIFSDEISYKKLLIELWDRDIISVEAIREEFNFIDSIESSRILKETKRRKKGTIPPKASTFHDPMVKDKLVSDLVKTGNMDGDEMGVDVKKDDVFSKNAGGRPVGVKDTIKRDPKKVSTRKVVASFMETQVWAREALDKITEVIGGPYLEEKSKANFRQLSDEESNQFEDLKLSILMGISPFSSVNQETIEKSISNIKVSTVERGIRDALLFSLSQKIKRPQTMDDKRIASAAAYAISVLSEQE